MILLDTNVVSEFTKPQPATAVVEWLDNQVPETLYLSSVTLAELLYGVAALPDGKRKVKLVEIINRLVEGYDGRVLTFDIEAARHYAQLAVNARRQGRGFPTPDGYIAAIAAAHGFSVASRDTAPFEAAGVKVINPWRD